MEANNSKKVNESSPHTCESTLDSSRKEVFQYWIKFYVHKGHGKEKIDPL